MKFEKETYEVNEIELEGKKLIYRSYANLAYADKPVNPEFQQMNLFVPESFYQGKSINGYSLHTAPIFMPNTVGGYMPGYLAEPGYEMFGPRRINAIFYALLHGYVVAAPALRGRTQKADDQSFNGKAPACIVDYKAAVRYLKYFSEVIPGDTGKIITNGTSAGGALSALMGATGNHKDYEQELDKIGAAKASDSVFAASCYCPITNLEHGDMAYEWQFQGIHTYHRMNMNLDEGGRVDFTPEDGVMNELQIQVSEELKEKFPEYVNSLHLKDSNGKELQLDKNGTGSFLNLIKSIILDSAQKAMEKGINVAEKNWILWNNGKPADLDFHKYAEEITRMKTAPAFDDLKLRSPENNLFGTAQIEAMHFTDYSSEKGVGKLADPEVIKMMNPMAYIRDKEADTANYFRIRHGEEDRDTSLAISAILATMLKNQGSNVDYQAPWAIPHSGDYDLEELFSWIDKICR